jgi:hypothetical protein
MRETMRLLVIVALASAIGVCSGLAAETVRGFGFGGPMAMAFFPDMSGINSFMSENGLPSMGEFMIGAGGSGRGGVIGGPAFGGIGWGIVATSEGEDRSAEFVFGGGGFDMGTAIGGDEGSVLTIGAVLGGGANVLTVTGAPVETEGGCPCGLVVEPTRRELGRVLGFVQPYVSMAAQLLPWMGFELRIGYLLPVFGIDFGDSLGIPAPSLTLSGPTVSLGFTFGGIGSLAEPEVDEPSGKALVTTVSEGTFAIEAGQLLIVENALGEIVVSAHGDTVPQTASDRIVEWQATLTCSEKRIEELQVVLDTTDAGTTLKTVGAGRVNYVLRIPGGIDLTIRNGTGNVSVLGHEAQTIIVENGVGDVDLQGVQAVVLIVAGGVGRIDLPDVDAQVVIAELGLGEISLALPESASATVTAKAAMGDVSIDRFPGMIGGVRGFLGKTADVQLGNGERTVELNVGVGRIGIEMQVP